jgi:ElaB/YqjD/DUF883 family membrane-anchored ribosome-binding protein
MTTATASAAAVEAIKQRLIPALNTRFDEKVRQGRRTFVRGQHAAEDAAAAATLIVRRRPLSSVMVAAGAGILAGALVGFALARLARCED